MSTAQESRAVKYANMVYFDSSWQPVPYKDTNVEARTFKPAYLTHTAEQRDAVQERYFNAYEAPRERNEAAEE